MNKDQFIEAYKSRDQYVWPAEFVMFCSNIVFSDGCWSWVGAKTKGGHHHYGQFSLQHPFTKPTAHRIAYEVVHGPVSDKLEIDHLCLNTLCVNPDHLEAVTQGENRRRAFKVKKQREDDLQ
jgi:hypothetical protein